MLWLTLRQLKSSNAIKRVKAAEKLAASPNAQAFEHLVAALTDADFEVRMVSARGLGQFGERAVEPLVSALKDKSSSVRETAVGSLAKIGGQHIVMPLMDLLEDEDSGVRKAAANVLEKIGAPESKQALEEYHCREEEARRLDEEARAKRLAEEEEARAKRLAEEEARLAKQQKKEARLAKQQKKEAHLAEQRAAERRAAGKNSRKMVVLLEVDSRFHGMQRSLLEQVLGLNIYYVLSDIHAKFGADTSIDPTRAPEHVTVSLEQERIIVALSFLINPQRQDEISDYTKRSWKRQLDEAYRGI